MCYILMHLFDYTKLVDISDNSSLSPLMSLLSKVLRDRRSQTGLVQVWSRMFRWDAKPDNIQVSESRHSISYLLSAVV